MLNDVQMLLFCVNGLLLSLLYLQQQLYMKSMSCSELKQTPWHPNRSYLQLTTGIVLDSCFPGGNIASASILSNNPLTIEVEGNTDITLDNTSKYWLYFRIRGFRKDRPLKFILKNANHLRKYFGQPRYKAYMVYRQQHECWQAMQTPIDITILQGGQYQGSFTFLSDKYGRQKKIANSTNDLYPLGEEKFISTTNGSEQSRKGSCYFAIYYPYSYDDLNKFIFQNKIKFGANQSINAYSPRKAYFNQETLVYTYERRKISLITITSFSNIETYSEREPLINQEIFPNAKERPYKLKNNPVILFTARVHPSQTSSSFFIEGLVQFLLGESRAASILREMFIFQIIPMLNPDGVEHGNFRFDHQLRNLNRFYGQSSIQKTPSIRAAELLIEFYKNKRDEQSQFTSFYEQTYCRLFMYVDVHGHSSALPSFIYGNHTQKLQHMIENRLFCKLLENNFVQNGFSKIQSQFSKKNMTLQQKYDQFSKQCAGRVFAGRAQTAQVSIFHSYTLQILPYWQQFPKRKNEQKNQKTGSPQYAKLLGKAFLISLLDLLDLNPQSKFNEFESDKLRKLISKECLNEQSRKQFLQKRNDYSAYSAQRNSYSQLGKPKNNLIDRQYNFYNQYIQRWFSNQILINHFYGKDQLIGQAKFYKFYHKVAKINHLSMPSQLCESPRKFQRIEKTRKCESQHRGNNMGGNIVSNSDKSKTSIVKDQRKFSDQKIIFVCRAKDKNKIESKINKQTIQLRDDFFDAVTRQKTIEKDQQVKMVIRKQFIRKQFVIKGSNQSTERYQQQILNKINKTGSNCNPIKPVFQIKSKQLQTKHKNNNRIQTETITSQPTHFQNSLPDPIQSSNSLNNSANGKDKDPPINKIQTLNCCYGRPSFIQQFMIKIKEERQSNVFVFKANNRQDLKQKAIKIRPSLKDQVQQQSKHLLPILQRNKIFTLAPQGLVQRQKGYQSITQQKKRVATEQSPSNLQQNVLKTKKILAIHKKQEIIRQQILKKSQKMSQYKCN